MEKLKPKFFTTIRDYSKEQFIKDVISGIIAGFLVSFLGGSKVQIAGPTAAFATIVAGIVAKSGMDGLIVATINWQISFQYGTDCTGRRKCWLCIVTKQNTLCKMKSMLSVKAGDMDFFAPGSPALETTQKPTTIFNTIFTETIPFILQKHLMIDPVKKMKRKKSIRRKGDQK